MGSWDLNLMVRYNQDTQRDFEEKATAQMIALLTKRTLLEHNLHSKSHSLGKHNNWNNNIQPIGIIQDIFCSSSVDENYKMMILIVSTFFLYRWIIRKTRGRIFKSDDTE